MQLTTSKYHFIFCVINESVLRIRNSLKKKIDKFEKGAINPLTLDNCDQRLQDGTDLNVKCN